MNPTATTGKPRSEDSLHCPLPIRLNRQRKSAMNNGWHIQLRNKRFALVYPFYVATPFVAFCHLFIELCHHCVVELEKSWVPARRLQILVSYYVTALPGCARWFSKAHSQAHEKFRAPPHANSTKGY